MTDASSVIGIDGTSGGWIASIGSAKKKCLTTIKFSESLDRLLSGFPNSVVVIDMPIELNKKKYLRKCLILLERFFQEKVLVI